MAQLIVRNIDEALVLALKHRAARHGRSAEAEHRAILAEALASERLRTSFKDFLASMPDVGEDDELVPPRDMPRRVGL